MTDFLQTADVLLLHSDQVERHGGEHGVRDLALLDSAVAQPQARFDGKHLHADIFEMAAAYLFHIVRNHPFVDGNKRTGAVAALVFLDINGVEVEAPRGSVYELTMAVANGNAGKAEIAAFLRGNAH